MLSGSTRMTYSICVMIMETTSNVNLYLPIIFTMFSAYSTGFIFNDSLYAGMLRSKDIPILKKQCPKINRDLSAAKLMTRDPKSFN